VALQAKAAPEAAAKEEFELVTLDLPRQTQAPVPTRNRLTWEVRGKRTTATLVTLIS